MSLNIKVQDGAGKHNLLKVNDEKAALVQSTELPPLEQSGQGVIYRDFLKNDAGSFDMRANGSTSSVDFYVNADPTYDLYIKTISFLIADAGATLNNFGNIGALTNGCQLLYKNNQGEIFINEGLKTNFSFVRLAQGKPSFGDGTTAFRANNISGSSEGYLPSLDLANIFGIPYGIKLRKETTDRIILRVRDDLTGVDEFTAVAYGFTRR